MITAAKNKLYLSSALLITSLLAGDQWIGGPAQPSGTAPEVAHAPVRERPQVRPRPTVPFVHAQPLHRPSPTEIVAAALAPLTDARKIDKPIAADPAQPSVSPANALAEQTGKSTPSLRPADWSSAPAIARADEDAESPRLTPAVLTRWMPAALEDVDSDALDEGGDPALPESQPDGVAPEISGPAEPVTAPAKVAPSAPEVVEPAPSEIEQAPAAVASPVITPDAQPLAKVPPAIKMRASVRARAIRAAKTLEAVSGTPSELSSLIASTERLKAVVAKAESLPRDDVRVALAVAPNAVPLATNDTGISATTPTPLPSMALPEGIARDATMASVASSNFRKSIAAARTALGEPPRGAAVPPAPVSAAPVASLPAAANDSEPMPMPVHAPAPPPEPRAADHPAAASGPIMAPAGDVSAARRDASARFRASIATARAALDDPAPLSSDGTALSGSTEASSDPQETPRPPRINTYGREIVLDFPLSLNDAALGDLPLRIGLDDTLAVSPEALVALLGDKLDAQIAQKIIALPRVNGMVVLDRLRTAGLEVRFDLNAARIEVRTAVEGGSETAIAIARGDAPTIGTYATPASVSGYLNLAAGIGYEAVGPRAGATSPILSGSLGVRLGGVVFESDFTGDFGASRRFSRSYSRLVFDQPEHDRRFVAGDILASSTGLLSAPSMLGIGVERQPRIFDPSRNLRPQSYQSFALNNASQVDVVINGVTVRRLSLAPGSYRLSDFPFVSGSNNVQIVATDNLGRRDVADFTNYYDFSLLQPGMDEFSFNAGFLATQGRAGPHYDFSRPAGNFAYRRGLSQSLTLGGGLQVDRATQAASLQGNMSTPLGTFLAEGSASHNKQLGVGFAGRLIYQWGGATLGNRGFSGLGFAVDYTSRNYTSVTTFLPQPAINALRLSGTTSFRLSKASYVTLGGSYATRRDNRPDTYEASVRLSQRLDRGTYLSVGGGYQRSESRARGAFFQIGLTRRFGGRGYGSAEFDSRTERGRLNYSNAGSGNAGDFDASGSLDVGKRGLAGNGSITLRTSYATLGLNEGVAFDIEGRRVTSSRTNATAATSLMFADGAVAIGRPVTDSFAIVRPHATLKSASLYVNRRDDAYLARSGIFGGAAVTELASYSDRSLTVDVPDAPIGYELGASSFRVRPPYHAGYKLTVGSEFTLSAMGYLKENGQPILLASGRATLIGNAKAPVVEIFTDRAGRFGASGLKPGRYRIDLDSSPPRTFEMVIPADAEGLVRVGDLEAQ